MTWIYFMPTWLFAVLTIGVMCACSAGGLYLVRRYGPRTENLTHNDVAGPISATVGTILAVMLSFMVVTVWQEFDASAANVQNEASAVIDLYHLARSLPDPERTTLRDDVRVYVRAVLDSEWPLMRTGQRSPLARAAEHRLASDIYAYRPKDPSLQALQSRALDLTQIFVDARRRRLFDNDQGIPPVLWTIMILVSAVTIAMTFLFRVDRERPHMLMTIALAAVIGATFVLIAELDYPFRGNISISPAAFVHAEDVVTQPALSPKMPYY